MNKPVEITPEELDHIYRECGHPPKYPATIRALTVAMNLVASRINERIVSLTSAILLLSRELEALKGRPVPRQTRQETVLCYCGTPVVGPGACEVCGRAE